MRQEAITKKMFLWNIIGCVLNSAASFVLLAFVTRTVDITEAGYFSIAFATAQLLLSFGKFGVRAFQATDVNNEISAKAFIVNRLITSVGMILLGIVYVLISGYNLHKATVVICVCAIKVVDAVEDVFHGDMQLNGHIDKAGKLLTFRNLLTIVLFAVLIFTTQNLVLTCSVTAVLSLAVCIISNVYVLRKIERPVMVFEKKHVGKIFRDCFPLFIGSFLSILIYNMPKYAIDSFSTEHIQTVYNIIFMPAFVINMMSEFIFKPLLTPLACYWNDCKMKEVKKIILKLLVILIGLTVFVLAGGYVLGIPVLELVYGIELAEFKRELMLLLLGGGFSATVYLAYNLLTMMRVQKYILPGYIGGLLYVAVLAWIFVINFGITGAAMTYLTVEVLMCCYFLVMIGFAIKKRQVNNET